ncbi:M14 family zinc carboxypeptidase [Qipengyuania sp. ASV99]|uniref:M14 family metallopeptidase n=1 Tax=Qipengyuania sp. ASV99 TaxID=3399681 RepID=UPI003A4C82E8
MLGFVVLSMGLSPAQVLANEALATAESGTTCAADAAIIDKDFPTGAYAHCTASGGKRFNLMIAPEDEGDINCSAWYAFRITPLRAARITINLDYETCGHRYWPKTSTDGVNWTAVSPDDVKVEGERGARTAQIRLRTGVQPVFVAAQEILPPSVYDAWLDGYSAKPFLTRSVLGQSAEQRDIEIVRIADPAATPLESVVLVGRQHPPEITGALAMFAFAETIMGDSDLAQAYRARFETLMVPLLNPDGVVRGHWRHNTGGVDLNRDWGPFTQPETALMKGVLDSIAADPLRQLRGVIDFHSTNKDVFYTIPDDLPTDPELFTRNWLNLYQERMPDYTVNREARHDVGRPISKAYAYDTYGVPGITFEIGDETDRALIRRIGREAAIAMMQVMLETPMPAAAAE